MTELILAIMGICLLLYVVLGGADFGGGILELITRGKDSGVVGKAIAPVWEANHVWLILVLVILFVAFPVVYSTILTTLHIPVLLALIGIILRGSAFTFRHYDIEEEKPMAIYTSVFRISSLLTTFFLGVTMGALILGDITDDYSKGFYQVFIRPWFNLFSFSLGLFLVILFAFLANIYTIGEVRESYHINRFTRWAKQLIMALVVAGLFVFLAAEVDNLHLFNAFYHSPVSVACVALATLALPLLWTGLNRNSRNLIRIVAGFQTTMIVLGWFAIQLPVLVRMNNGDDITYKSAAAPVQTQYYMLIALVAGVLIIFPYVGYLYKTFKFGKDK
ncbi:MAG: cytochrome d ubiquinol oxidase subunit II [Mangrovibacterium sp.]